MTVGTVRRFTEFTNEYPWRWSAADLEDWTSQLISKDHPLAHSTVRSYQLSVAMFLDFLIDSRYGRADECETRFSTHPVQICHEWNMATHTNGYEGHCGSVSVVDATYLGLSFNATPMGWARISAIVP